MGFFLKKIIIGFSLHIYISYLEFEIIVSSKNTEVNQSELKYPVNVLE
jgi:hypothetical protein